MIKSRVFLKLITSYMAVLVVPLCIVGLVIYTTLVDRLTADTMNTTAGMLQQVCDVMDTRFADLNSITYQISNSSVITPLFASNTGEQVELYPTVFNSIKTLKDYKIANSIVDNILIFFRNRDMILTDTGKFDLMTYSSHLHMWQKSTPGEFQKFMAEADRMMVLPSQPANVNSSSVNLIAYIQPLPANASQYNAALLITIKESVVQQLMQKILGVYNGHVFIVDSKNEIIVRSSLGEDADDASRAGMLIKNLIRETPGGTQPAYSSKMGKYLVSYVKSNTTGWKYIAVLPSSQIFQKVDYIKRACVIVLLLSLVVGLFFVICFSRGNYSKVRKITDMILSTREAQDGAEECRNEWYLINSTLSHYISTTETLRKKLADQIPLIRNDFLLRLLNGDIKDMDTTKSMEEFIDIKLDYGYSAVMIIAIDDYTRFDNENSEPAQGMMKLAIADAAEEMCSAAGRGYAVLTGRDRVCMVVGLNTDNKLTAADALKAAGQKVCRLAREKLGITVTIALSGIHTDILYVEKAYKEAESALGYRILNGNDAVICFSDIADRMNNIYFYTFEQENRIIQYLRQGEYDSIRGILDNSIGRIKSNPVSIEIVRCIYFEIINTAIKAANELDIKGVEHEDCLRSMLEAITIDDVYREVCRFYAGLCEKINNSKQCRSGERKNRVISCIDRSYMDSSFSLEMLAGELSVSASYMGKFFRDQMGLSFVDYLNSVRVQKAKELLLGTDMNINDIAVQTGYNSAYNFTRVFKRYENITPGQFRMSRYASDSVNS